ncbi:MAG: 3,4-dihydroxy 2-butanone 4-phosphate synthase/GTP cyclohydrolase II [Myxococcota bacterium]|jgi:3,4-dihydroxy 2-butanone 4-phosphate synthase/GTP cyclohydrolase II
MTDSQDVLHPDPITRVELAIADIKAGKMVILVDDEDRENEGDIVIAAEMCTPEAITFMVMHARGLVCLSMTSEQIERLALPMMATNNQSAYETAFTVSIEARHNVTTGISSADRSETIRAAIQPDATPRDIVTPGHMFPLRARAGGVLERVGQTEGSVDLSRMSGLMPAGVICEIIRDDGEMARMPDLMEFGAKHNMRIVAVADLIKYRMRNERIVTPVEDGTVEVPGLGTFHSRLYEGMRGEHHMALWQGEITDAKTTVRVQASPPPWSFLGEPVSKAARQAQAAMVEIAKNGGALVLMHQNGGGVAELEAAWRRDFAGTEPALPRATAEALRDLGAGCQILVDLGCKDIRLLTSSKRPIVGIESYGLSIVERVSLDV